MSAPEAFRKSTGPVSPRVLEVASRSGQCVNYLGGRFPHVSFQPSVWNGPHALRARRHTASLTPVFASIRELTEDQNNILYPVEFNPELSIWRAKGVKDEGVAQWVDSKLGLNSFDAVRPCNEQTSSTASSHTHPHTRTHPQTVQSSWKNERLLPLSSSTAQHPDCEQMAIAPVALSSTQLVSTHTATQQQPARECCTHSSAARVLCSAEPHSMRPTPPPYPPPTPPPYQVYALDVLEPSKPLEDPENPASEAPPLTEGLIASAARMLNSDGFLYIYGRINFSEGLSITQLATKVICFSPTHPLLPYAAPRFPHISPFYSCV